MIAFGVGTVSTWEAISSGVGRPPPSTVQTPLATRWASALDGPARTMLARTSSIALRAHTLVRITVLPPHDDGRPRLAKTVTCEVPEGVGRARTRRRALFKPPPPSDIDSRLSWP